MYRGGTASAPKQRFSASFDTPLVVEPGDVTMTLPALLRWISDLSLREIMDMIGKSRNG